MSMTLSKFKDTKKIEDFRLKILWKLIMNLRMKINLVTVRPKNGYLKQTLNSINVFLPSLVMSYVGLQLKLLSMYLYKSMTPFRMNFKLVINKHWFRFHDYFPGFDSSSNDVMLSGISKYICFYHFNTISFEVYI